MHRSCSVDRGWFPFPGPNFTFNLHVFAEPSLAMLQGLESSFSARTFSKAKVEDETWKMNLFCEAVHSKL